MWATPAARTARTAWSAYAFDWSTAYCSSSPVNPCGFPFSMSCARPDVGYRTYKAARTFGAVTKAACDSAAWTYYRAVRAFA